MKVQSNETITKYLKVLEDIYLNKDNNFINVINICRKHKASIAISHHLRQMGMIDIKGVWISEIKPSISIVSHILDRIKNNNKIYLAKHKSNNTDKNERMLKGNSQIDRYYNALIEVYANRFMDDKVYFPNLCKKHGVDQNLKSLLKKLEYINDTGKWLNNNIPTKEDAIKIIDNMRNGRLLKPLTEDPNLDLTKKIENMSKDVYEILKGINELKNIWK